MHGGFSSSVSERAVRGCSMTAKVLYALKTPVYLGDRQEEHD